VDYRDWVRGDDAAAASPGTRSSLSDSFDEPGGRAPGRRCGGRHAAPDPDPDGEPHARWDPADTYGGWSTTPVDPWRQPDMTGEWSREPTRGRRRRDRDPADGSGRHARDGTTRPAADDRDEGIHTGQWERMTDTGSYDPTTTTGEWHRLIGSVDDEPTDRHDGFWSGHRLAGDDPRWVPTPPTAPRSPAVTFPEPRRPEDQTFGGTRRARHDAAGEPGSVRDRFGRPGDETSPDAYGAGRLRDLPRSADDGGGRFGSTSDRYSAGTPDPDGYGPGPDTSRRGADHPTGGSVTGAWASGYGPSPSTGRPDPYSDSGSGTGGYRTLPDGSRRGGSGFDAHDEPGSSGRYPPGGYGAAPDSAGRGVTQGPVGFGSGAYGAVPDGSLRGGGSALDGPGTGGSANGYGSGAYGAVVDGPRRGGGSALDGPGTGGSADGYGAYGRVADGPRRGGGSGLDGPGTGGSGAYGAAPDTARRGGGSGADAQGPGGSAGGFGSGGYSGVPGTARRDRGSALDPDSTRGSGGYGAMPDPARPGGAHDRYGSALDGGSPGFRPDGGFGSGHAGDYRHAGRRGRDGDARAVPDAYAVAPPSGLSRPDDWPGPAGDGERRARPDSTLTRLKLPPALDATDPGWGAPVRPRPPQRPAAATRTAAPPAARPPQRPAAATRTAAPAPAAARPRSERPMRGRQDEFDLDTDSGGYLAAVLYAAAWYAVPVLVFGIWLMTLSGVAPASCVSDVTGGGCESPRAHALTSLLSGVPQFGVALALSLVAAVALRWLGHSWRAGSVGLAAAVVGGGLSTVLTSVLTGQPIG